MKQGKKKGTTAPRGEGSEFNELLIQAMRTGAVLAEKGLVFAEDLACRRNLFRTYPYLKRALTNVKNVISLLQISTTPAGSGKVDVHERRGRKKGHKKISK